MNKNQFINALLDVDACGGIYVYVDFYDEYIPIESIASIKLVSEDHKGINIMDAQFGKPFEGVAIYLQVPDGVD